MNHKGKPNKSHTTHYACDEQLEKYGGKTKGCCCTGHECNTPTTDEPLDADQALKEFGFDPLGAINDGILVSLEKLNQYITKAKDEAVRQGREIFIPVRGAEGYYEVSNTGKVRSVAGGRRKGVELKQQTYIGRTNRGYRTVSLCKNGKTMTAKVHQLVARAFLSNPLKKPTVNHIDGDKGNNDVRNLEWATHGENELHAHANGKVVWNKGRMGIPAHKTRLQALSQNKTGGNDDKL